MFLKKNGISILFAILMATLLSPFSSKAQYTLNSPYGDLLECDTMSRGPFLFWWDNDFNYAAQIAPMLDSMIAYRTECLNDLGMQDPTSVQDGFYCNIYIHSPGNSNCFFSTNYPSWGNGVGGDLNGYAFMTLPDFVLGDWRNIAHETFHIFQSRGMWDLTPGIYNTDYGGWFVEASANWYADQRYPNDIYSFVVSEILVRIPQVPIWLDFYNGPVNYPSNWQRDVHQYALSTYLFYLTDVIGIPQNTFSHLFYSGTTITPQEYLFNQLGAENFRSYFMDGISHMTNHFDFINSIQLSNAINEWNTYADPSDDNKFIETYNNTGSGGWFRPLDDEVTSAWSFNTYKLLNNQNESYVFELNGDPLGFFEDSSFFQGKIVVQNSSGSTSFHDLIMQNNYSGSVTVNLTSSDTAVLFVIASMPEVFEDYAPDFQTFSYEMRIYKESTAGIDEYGNAMEKIEISRFNLLGQKIEKGILGLQFIHYNDGTKQKVYVNE